MGAFKKLLLSTLSFLILFVSSLSYFSAPEARAQSTNPWYNQSFTQWYTKVYDTQTSPPQEIFGERYTAAQVQWVMYSLIAMFPNFAQTAITCIFKGGGVDSCAAQNPMVAMDTSTQPYVEKGVLATLFNPNRSLSGVNYVREKLASLSIIPEAQAQNAGFGFYALGPVQNIWQKCRDIMYGLFVIIIIVFAFMIMFRVKLNPQTVVSIQSAIPKIIITLILVTFSYAIAGLMIDLMYVVIGLVALIFTQFDFIQGGSGRWEKVFTLLTDGPGGAFGIGGIIGWLTGIFWPFAVAFFQTIFYLFGLGGAGGVGLGILWGILAFFLTIGVFIWLLLTSVKVFILLIRTYITILISVIFSPFLIGFGAIGPIGGFGTWLKNLVANLAVYPVAGALLMLCVLFLSATYPEVNNNLHNFLQLGDSQISNIFSATTAGGQTRQFWYPPLTLGTQNSATGWDPLPILWTFAALAILAMVPSASNMVKSLMAGKGIEAPDLTGKGGLLAGGLGFAAGAAGGLVSRNILTPFVYNQAKRAEAGEGGFFSRSVSSWGVRRGYIRAPSTTFVTKQGTWYETQPKGQTPKNPNPPSKP